MYAVKRYVFRRESAAPPLPSTAMPTELTDMPNSRDCFQTSPEQDQNQANDSRVRGRAGF